MRSLSIIYVRDIHRAAMIEFRNVTDIHRYHISIPHCTVSCLASRSAISKTHQLTLCVRTKRTHKQQNLWMITLHVPHIMFTASSLLRQIGIICSLLTLATKLSGLLDINYNITLWTIFLVTWGVICKWSELLNSYLRRRVGWTVYYRSINILECLPLGLVCATWEWINFLIQRMGYIFII